MYLRALALLLCAVYVALPSAQAFEEDQEKVENALRVLEHLTETRKGLSKLQGVVEGIDKDLVETQKRNCQVGGGMSHHCAAAFLDSQLTMQDYLKSGMSPGKRGSPAAAAGGAGADSEIARKVKDLQRKRRGLQLLKRILQEMDSDLVHEQKRTCLVNLGGHCATESAASMADQWHYLNSPLSPGRKRRETNVYNKLVRGQLIPKEA